MISKLKVVPITVALAALGVACTNPTVDPASTFIIEGKALDTSGNALANADVRVVRYFHPTKLLVPSVDDLFDCQGATCGYVDVNLEIALVRTGKTDMSGAFNFEVKGEDIKGAGGVTDVMGKVEVSNVVIVVLDPNDADKVAGVFSYDHLFQQTDKRWDAGNLRLWDSGATADVTNAATSGLVKFGWNKLQRGASSVKNDYRVEVRGANRSLRLRCLEGVSTIEQGGCIANGGKFEYTVSAFSIWTWYGGASFKGWVRGDGVDYRYRAKFTITGTFANPTTTRDKIGAEGVWAVTDTADQKLDGTKATDGDPTTREAITGTSRAIYVKLPLSLVTDAGLLNTLVPGAYNACVVLEFNATAFNDITAAKAGSQGWETKGKFCGGQGGDNEMSALASFDTTSSAGVQAAWLRFRLEGNTSASFKQVGEVAVYKKQ